MGTAFLCTHLCVRVFVPLCTCGHVHPVLPCLFRLITLESVMWNRTDADSFGGLNKLYENVVLKIHCSALNQWENADTIMNVFFKLLAFISEVIIDQQILLFFSTVAVSFITISSAWPSSPPHCSPCCVTNHTPLFL